MTERAAENPVELHDLGVPAPVRARFDQTVRRRDPGAAALTCSAEARTDRTVEAAQLAAFGTIDV